MSEQFDAGAIRDFLKEVMRSAPNIMKGISDYGSFTTEENAQRYIEKLGLKSVAGAHISKIFVKNILDKDIYSVEDYELSEDLSLWSLLESAAEIAQQFGLRDIDDYKAGLVMRFDDTYSLCLRLDFINPKFSGREEAQDIESLVDAKRYEVVLTSQPEEINWMGYNLYD